MDSNPSQQNPTQTLSPRVPADLHIAIKKLQETQVGTNWQNRRRIVAYSLLLFGTLISLFAITATFGIVWEIVKNQSVEISGVLGKISTTVLWISSLAFLSIIGSYVFGAQWDISSFRGFITNLFNR